MNRGPIVQKIADTLSSLYPTIKPYNIYAYPEVKIHNYMDAQYYG
jgi:hypothetical protein